MERLSLPLFGMLTWASIAAPPIGAQVTMEPVPPQWVVWSGNRSTGSGLPLRIAASRTFPGASDSTGVVLSYPRRPKPLDFGDHKKAGLVGGTVMGLLGAVVGDGLCHFDDPCRHPAPFVIGGFVLGAAAGAAIGVRVGTWHGEEVLRLDVGLGSSRPGGG